MGVAPTLRRGLGRLAAGVALAGVVVLFAMAYRRAPVPVFGLAVVATALPAAAYIAWCAHPRR